MKANTKNDQNQDLNLNKCSVPELAKPGLS
jgi:hypothetical protein